ncbi:MFS transporter [Treponema sp.]|uniref:MFS transporter n=1 Tax=Treponema sp. TaxID=166 RepID=UPI00298D95AC|nr:MFS transporter [Treponema sp.]
MMKNYKKTKLACYLGFITQAVAANFAPLLFLKFHTDYNISLGNIAMISTSFFFTQLLVDLFCAKYVDKIGYRVCIVASEVCSAAGLVGLAFLPEIIPSPFIGIIISVILYAIGSGLIEVLGSPIVEACPFENKEATMSLLHSFYCWGAVGTILVSTVFFLLFGIGSWKWLAVIFALIPAINIINFATCPIESLVEEGQGMGIRKLFSNPMFLIAIVMMVSSKAFPTGGTAMFALLAMAGDLGGSIGPAIVGRVADMFGGSIHVGMRIGLLFPITLCFMLFLFNIMNHNANKQKGKTNEITCDRYTKRNNR